MNFSLRFTFNIRTPSLQRLHHLMGWSHPLTGHWAGHRCAGRRSLQPPAPGRCWVSCSPCPPRQAAPGWPRCGTPCPVNRWPRSLGQGKHLLRASPNLGMGFPGCMAKGWQQRCAGCVRAIKIKQTWKLYSKKITLPDNYSTSSC